MAPARRIALFSSVVAGAAAAAPSVSFAQTVYVGPVGGDWGTASNWLPAVVPTASDNVVVDNRTGNFSVLTGAGATRAANNLTINSGDAVELSNGSSLTLGGNLSGAGTLRFNVAANRAVLGFNSATASIAAASIVDFNYQGAPNADGAITGPSTGTLTNNGLIRGSGTLDNVRFTNSSTGILENYQTSAQLYLDANNQGAGLFINNGTIRALAGSLVTFTGANGGDYISTNGLIQANGNGAVVRLLSGASITDGTYSTSGTGQIVVDTGNTATATGFANQGLFVLRNGSQLTVGGTIANTGTIDFTQPYTSEALLNVASDTTLTGAGVVQMDYSNVAGNSAGVITGNGTLTVAAAQTIRGVGSLRNLRCNNAGLIDANSGPAAVIGAGMYIDPNNQGAGLFTNTGTIRSSSGGLMVLSGDSGGDLVNTGGTIASIGTNSLTELYNSIAITGGTFTTSGGGLIRVRPGQTATLNGPITLTSGSRIQVPATTAGGATLNLNGTVTNTGSTIELNAAGNLSLLNINGTTTINGGTLSGVYTNTGSSPGARIDTSTNLLTLAASTTTQGVIYFNNARVTNNGTMNATDPNGMVIDPSNQGVGVDYFNNNGLMEATGGGLMVLAGDNGGGLTNTNGTISSIGTGSVVEIYNSLSLTGGTYTTSGGGVMRIRPGHTASLNGPITFTSGSKFTVPGTAAGGATLNLNGTVTNTGSTIELNAAGNLSLLNINGTTTINGGTLSGVYTNTGSSPGTRIDTTTNLLTLAAGTTTQGVIYFNNARVTNNGTINATDPNGMIIDPNNQGAGVDYFNNNGLMEATGGGLMVLAGDYGGGLTNTNGTISSIGTGSVVEIYNSLSLTGGTFTTSGGGVMRIRPGHTASLNGPITITSGSKFTVPGTAAGGGATLNVAGTFTNNGTIELNAAGAFPLLNVAANTTITGTGTLNGVYGGTGSGPRIDTGTNTLTIGANTTAAGVFYFNNAKVINNGTLLANVHAVPTGVGQFDMYIDPNNSAGVNFVNNGTIRATNNAAIGFTGDYGGPFGGTGPIVVDAGAVIGSWNSASGDMGPVSGAGIYRAAASSNLGQQSFRVGTLESITGATARITAGGGTVGTSKVTTLTIDTGSRVDVTDHGLIVDGTPEASVRGYLASGYNAGAWNGVGIDSSTANTTPNRSVGYGIASQVFTTVPATFLGQAITSSSVLVRYTTSGDADLNGVTNFADLLKLAKNYNLPGTWVQGDFDYNGTTEFNDLLILAKAYNQSLTAAQADELDGVAGNGSFASEYAFAQTLVPEPTSALATLGLASLVARSRRRA